MPAMTEVATTFVRRRGAKVRLPQPYIVEHGEDLFDFGCSACHVLVAGVRSRDTAQSFAHTHRCDESWTDQRRPWP